ncbi:NADP-specific glutamate dehydrogenase [Desulfogranum mediterraneum]|uniref:NADP-specific glutamate dehydrogenase n=1 Tax=Desulfogranum mediterraneum TaxID=160661 RepID=UPI00040D6530|nr:NADP-specific glutamate dehydrogenase [Desulfogranum mediterraneum]
MLASDQDRLNCFMHGLKRRNPHQPEFHQAVYEVALDVIPYIRDHPIYDRHRILERLTEPDRIVIFRVNWEDDQGNFRANRGYRVQQSNAIGPYKGGIRFHKQVSLDTLKFLAFEQTFKNGLTGLPMGGAKGGSDFNPKGKSEGEVMRFCQRFMAVLAHHIGPNTDVPAGDIGVGSREVSYMFGQYKHMVNQFTGAITGKGLSFGGSLIRTEATGYGAVYLLDNMLRHHGDGLENKTVLVSGSGNVAQYTVEKLIELGARVISMSDSSGTIHDPAGITTERLAWLKELKNVRRGRVQAYADEFKVAYYPGKRPWQIPCEIAIPCATQNEINTEDARTLLNNGCLAVVEGANMPTIQEGVDLYLEAGILYGPSKAANAGGVAISGLEMTQNSMRLSWSREELDRRLQGIMADIHRQCVKHGQEGKRVNYRKGANIAGFLRVADALVACGNI